MSHRNRAPSLDVFALQLPPIHFEDEEAGRILIAALDQFGEWVGLEKVLPGEEEAALTRLAARARETRLVRGLRCEPALAGAGRASGWRSQAENPGLEETRARAVWALWIVQDSDLRVPLHIANAFEVAVRSYEAAEPWKSERCRSGRVRLRTTVTCADEPELTRSDFFSLRVTPPAECCNASWLHFRRRGDADLVASFAEGFPPEILQRWLEERGVRSNPTLYRAAGLEGEVIEPVRLDEVVELITLIDVVAQIAHGRPDPYSMIGGGRAVAGAWPEEDGKEPTWEDDGLPDLELFEMGAQDAKPLPVRRDPATRIGRNDPCHCGSGLKYKRCHLEADRLASMLH